MKNYLATLLLGITAVMAINLTVDPTHRWRGRARIERAWNPGEVWVGPLQFDERSFRSAHSALISTPDVLVLGSSRAEMIDSRMFREGTRVYNAGMSGASVWDFVAIWQRFKEQGKIPRSMIILADTWILNRNTYAKYRWTSYAELVGRFLGGISAPRRSIASVWLDTAWQRAESGFYFLTDALSASVLKYSLFELRDEATGMSDPGRIVAEASRPMSHEAFRPDGALLYTADMERVSAAEVRQAALNTGRGSLYAYLQNWDFYPEALELLSLLIQDAEAHGVRTLLIAPPFHPATYEILRRRTEYSSIPAQFDAAMASILIGREKTHFCDAIDPATSGCGGDEFMDSSHAKRSCAAKILEACASGLPSWKSLLAGS